MNQTSTNTITLQAFESLMTEMIAFQQQQDQFSADLDKYVDGQFVTTFGGSLVNTIVDALEECFKCGDLDNPYGGLISWWLWDAPNAGKDTSAAWIGDGHTRYSVATIPLFYQYLSTGKTSEIHKEDDEPTNT